MEIKDLVEQGYVSIPYPEKTRFVVQEAMNSWKLFCGLSNKEKRFLSGGDRINDFGYMRRQDEGMTADNKELFHAVGANLDELRSKADVSGTWQAVQLIGHTQDLIEAVTPIVVGFAAAVEQQFELKGFENAVRNSANRWTFRYLHYFPDARSSSLPANSHADRGGFTLHLGESSPGGQYFSKDKMWQPWPVSEKQTIIFPSLVLQHFSNGALEALWHRVLASPETRRKGRYSMVAFIDFNHTHRFNDQKYRVQDFPHGFNYGRNLADLPRDLFVPRR